MASRRHVGAVWRWNGTLAYFLGLQVFLVPGGAAAQAIVPDGRTQTSVSVSGAVSDVRTSTVSGGNAFNSFSRFGVPSGATANLHLPGGTTNLVNIVRDQRTDVHGILNAIKDGRIGGNVYFANPYGFVVGAGGVVNVGSLTVSTPTAQFVDGFFSSPGNPDAAAVAQLLAGTAPRSGTGVIRIDGQVNAADGVALHAGLITVGGSVFSGARFVGTAPDFSDVVNANGLRQAGNVVAREGRIEIVADGDVTVSGTLAAPGGSGVRGGGISIAAGGGIDVRTGAVISSQGNGADSGGGSIHILAQDSAVLRAGSLIDASAGLSGDGGHVEFSARRSVELAGGELRADGTGGGRAGSVLIDPLNLVISADLLRGAGGYGTLPDGASVAGANLTLQADDNITIQENVTVSSRLVSGTTAADHAAGASIGNSGDIKMQSSSILLESGSQVLAHADGAFAGGAVSLEAKSQPAISILGYREATASIQVGDTNGGATIRGATVSLSAATDVSTRWLYETSSGGTWIDDPTDLNTAGRTLALGATTGAEAAVGFLAGLAGATIVHSQAIGTASVLVKGGSVVEGAQGVSLRAENKTVAGAAPETGLDAPDSQLKKVPLGLGALYARNKADASVTVESNATVKGENLTVRAHNDATLEAAVAAADAGSSDGEIKIAVGVTHADIRSSATIAQGAHVKVTGGVSVAATNRSSFSNTVEAQTGENGKASAAVAVSQLASQAIAELGADVKDAARIEVVAINENTKNVTTANSKTGQTLNEMILAGAQQKFQGLSDPSGTVENHFSDKLLAGQETDSKANASGGGGDFAALAAADDNDTPKATKFRIGGAIAYVDSNTGASASVGDGAKLHASEQVVVAARTKASEIQIAAESSAISQSRERTAANTARTTFSAGVVLGSYEHNALAKAGSGALITAPRIGIASDVVIPIRETILTTGSFTRWDGLSTIKDWLDDLTGAFDVFNGASAAKSTSDNSDGSVSLSGSVSILSFRSNARSLLETGAVLNLSGSQAGAWTHSFEVVADNPATTGPDQNEQVKHDVAFAAPAHIKAERDTTLLFHGGHFLPGDSGAERGLGLAYTQATLTGTAESVVREGARIQGVDETASAPDADGARTWTVDAARATAEAQVSADSKDLVISIAAAGGHGSSFGLNGSASIVEIDNATRALVDEEATVRAERFSVLANDTPVAWSIAGGFNKSSSAGVGVGISYNGLTAHTEAAIADNDAHSTDGADRSSQASVAGALIASRELAVQARSGGRAESIAVTGAVSSSSPNNDTSSGGFFSSVEGKYQAIQDKLAHLVDVKPTSISKSSGSSQGGTTAKQPSKFGLSGAGSASVNRTDITTTARLEGAAIDQHVGTGPAALAVRALSDTDIITASGAAALTRANNSNQTGSAAISGSVAVNLIDSSTQALLKNATVSGVHATTVQALAGGEQLSIAIGAAIDASNQQSRDKSFAATGSLSLSLVDNEVRAALENADVTGEASASGRDVEVTGYNRTFIGTGGGTLALGGKTGAGGSVTYSDVTNDVTASIAGGSVLTEVDAVAVKAYNATEIGAGAAHGQASNATNGNALGGAVVITEITNTTSAAIENGSSVTATGAVDVLARDRGADDALEALITPDAGDRSRRATAKGLDYCGRDGGGVGATPDGNCITSVAGVVQLGRGNNIGLSFNWSDIHNNLTAKVDGATVTSSGTAPVTVSAASNTAITSFAVGVGVSDKVSGAGSVAVNRIDNNILAGASGGAALSGESIVLEAKDKSRIDTLGGQVNIGKNAAVGAAVTYSEIANEARAAADQASLSARTSTSLLSQNDSRIRSLAVAGTFAGSGTAVSASISVNFIDNRTEATADNASFDDPAGGAATHTVSLTAENRSEIQSLAGSVAIGSTAGAGGAFAYNSIGNQTLASLESSTLSRVAALDVYAHETALIKSLSVAASGGQSAAISGSISLNPIENTTTAEIRASTVNGASATVNITAEDSSTIESLAGAVAVGLGGPAFGGAVADNATRNLATASVSASSLHGAASLALEAENASTIKSLSAAGSGAAAGAFAGSASSNRTENATTAEIASSEVSGGSANVSVTALDTATIKSLAGAIAASGSTAVGAAVAVNRIANVTEARITGVKAGTSGLDVDDLVVRADSNETIETIAVGGGVAADVGVAGSVAVNLISNTTEAHVSGGARVESDKNAGVIAESDDEIKVGAGAVGVGIAAAGVAASVVVNDIGGATKAHISGAGTEVAARAQSGTPALTVANGELTGAVDLDAGITGSLDAFTPPDLAAARATDDVRGVVVNASATHQVTSFVANIGAGLVGVSGVANVDVIGGQTQAYISQAAINQGDNSAASADQSVHVKASDHAYGANFVGSASGGVVGAGVVADVHLFDRDTRAYIDSSTVTSSGKTDVAAKSSQGMSSLVVGAAVGGVGVVGAGSVARFTSETESYVASSTVTSGSLDVQAKHGTRMYLSGGTASGGGIGAGATFDVGLDNSVTTAHVDDTTVATAGQVNVGAQSTSQIKQWTVAGSAAGTAAIAGTAAVALIGNTTQAYVTGGSIGSAGSRAAGLSITATDTVVVQQIAGSAAIAGIGGAGIAAGVAKVENTTSAYMNNAAAYTTNDIVVDAQATRDLSNTVATAGGGIAAGIGGSVGVTLVGSALSSSQDGETNANKELNSGNSGTLSQVNTFTGGDSLSLGGNLSSSSDNGYAGAGLSSSEVDSLNNRTKFSAGASVYAAQTQAPMGETFDPSTQLAGKTAAIVGGSSVLDAGRDVRVHASEKDRVRVVTGGGALGGLAGVGGSVSVADVTNNVEAAILGTTQTHSNTGKVEVIAEAGKLTATERAVFAKAVQAAGGAVALGAAVAVGENTNNVKATLGRGTSTTVASGAGGVTVRAADTSDVESDALGASGGLVAAGIVIARADKHGAAEARASNTSGTDATSVALDTGTMTVEARRSGVTKAKTVAGAGGVLAGAGSDARAVDAGLAKAYVGNGLAFAGPNGGLSVNALAQPETFARAEGYGGALAAYVGVSIAKAHAQPTVEAFIGDSTLTAGSVAVQASTAAPAGFTARSEATATGGGLLLGLTSTESAASSLSNVSASIRTGAELHVSGSTTVAASNSTDQSAWVSGVSVGGLAAGGEASSLAQSNSTTLARLDNGVGGDAGALAVRASGDDENASEAKSGGGAIVAGAAAKARTSDTSNTRAELGGGSGSDDADALQADAITLAAQHTARFNSSVDTLVAAVVGGSGGSAHSGVASRVESNILGNANLRAGSIDATAKNIGIKPLLTGYNAQAASGGLFSGAAAGSRSDISFVTLAGVGSQATVRLTGDPDDNPGSIVISAMNDVTARDRTKLDTGGAIAVARAQSQIFLNQADAHVTIGSGAQLYSVGDIALSSLTKADLEASANAKTYGLAGAAQGLSEAIAHSSNFTQIEANAALRAEGHIHLNAGRDENGQANVHRAKARTDLYNKTALPIETDPDANAIITTDNRIEVAGGAKVEAVKDIFLLANKGQMSSDGHGFGKDLYREILAAIGSFFSNLFGGGDVSLDIHDGFSSASGTATVTVNGLVAAGVQHRQRLVIAVDGSISEQTDGVRIRFRGTENLRSNIGARIIELQGILAQWSGEPDMKDALEAEVARLQGELDRLAPQPFSAAELDQLVANGTLTRPDADAILANQRPGGSLEGATLITVTEVDHVRARGGDIFVTGDSLGGAGTLKAPGDAEISLINNSPQYLRTNKLTIIDDVGGRVRLNGTAITAAGGLTIESSGPASARPKIHVENAYNPALAGDTSGKPAPDIQVRGDITNRFGDAIIKNVKGSIHVEAPPGTTSAPNILAETIRIEAGRDFVQAYVDGAVSVGGSPEALWNAEATAAQAGNVTVTRNASSACGSSTCKDGKGSVIAGNNVFISARYLNINGTVQSGLPDWQVTIPGVPGVEISADFFAFRELFRDTGYAGPAITQVGGKTFVPLQALVHARTHNIDVPYEFQQGPRYQLSGFASQPQGTVATFYNLDTNRIELDSVRVEGGYMELFGEILNTGGGRIKVMDGFGRINIANLSGFDLQMNGLDAGNVEGKLRITDTARRYLQSTGEILTNPADPRYLEARPVTTTYTRVGSDVTVEQTSKIKVTTNGVTDDQVIVLGSGLETNSRESFYDPVGGRKYVWGVGTDYTQGYYYSRQTSTFFDWPVATGAFSSASPFGSSNARDLTQTRLAWAGSGQTTDYQYTYRDFATSSPTLQWARNTNWCSVWLFGCIVRTYRQEYFWSQGRTEYRVHSVAADKRIPVEFVGYDSGAVTLSSLGNVILKSGIRAGNGLASVTSTGGTILSETSQPIIGNGISLGAQAGIGSAIAPIDVQLAGGALRAVTAEGNIGLRASGDARIELVSSGTGDVWITGNRSLLGVGSAVHHVNGRMVELYAAEAIGAAGDPLKVQTGGDSLQAGLIAKAPDAIHIDQPSGDLRLVRVESSGEVHLATQGSFVDGNLNDEKDTRAIDELQAQWAELRLLGAAAEQAADETVAGYGAERKRQYETYWSYRKTPNYDAQGRLTGTTIEAHNPNFVYVVSPAERSQLQANGLSDAQITGYAATRTAEYHSLHTELARTGDVAAYDPSWQPVVSDARRSELRAGAAWTENQLKYAIARGITAKSVTDTELRIEEANVKGDSVTLVSRAGGVGRNLGEKTYTTATVANLGPDDRANLAAAELDDIAMQDADTLRLTLRDDIDVQANRISIDARGRVYLGSELNLNIDALKTDDSIRIKGSQSIFRVATPTNPAAASISGGSLILEAAQGAIGTAVNPLTTSLMPGATLTARAMHDIHVHEIQGAMNGVDAFSRFGSVSLRAAGDLSARRIAFPGTLLLAGDDIEASITYLRTGAPLTASLSGGVTPAAGNVVLLIDGPQSVMFDRFWARDAVLLVPAELQISDGFIGSRMRIDNTVTRLLMDNGSAAPQPGYDIQLFAPDKTFWLYLNGNFVRTRLAHVIYRSEPSHPDLSENLEGADSSVRELAREELARTGRILVLPSITTLLRPLGQLIDVGASPVKIEE